MTTFFRLLKEHRTAARALEVLPAIAAEAGLPTYEPFSEKAARREMTMARAAGARLIAFGSTEYPAALADIPDPPPLIWVIGDAPMLSKPMIAVVGARNASSLGTRMAKRLAADLVEAGFVVVSGLARGVDAAAHIGAMHGGTVAVMAGGVDVIYPAENAEIAKEIALNGVRLSEAPMGLQPMARHFPRRNSLVSGLSQAVVVVEAAAQSGTLITAKNALDQGREVLAVPGHPFDGRAAGCNALIRDGATLVRGARDVIKAIQAPRPPVQASLPQVPKPPAAQPSQDDLHGAILERLGPSPIAEDQLIRDIGASAARLSPVLVALEVEGCIKRAPGGLISLAVERVD